MHIDRNLGRRLSVISVGGSESRDWGNITAAESTQQCDIFYLDSSLIYNSVSISWRSIRHKQERDTDISRQESKHVVGSCKKLCHLIIQPPVQHKL